MKRFANSQVITVSNPDEHHEKLRGRRGTVERLRMADDGAWVTMHEELPPELRSFPAADERGNNIILYPEECS